MRPNNHHDGDMPQDMAAHKRNSPTPNEEANQNWDEKSHLSRNIEKNVAENERRSLQADQEKRGGESNPHIERRRH